MANLGKARIKAKEKKGIVTVKAMAKHPMLSYQEAERAKKKADFITHIIGTVNGATVYEVSTSQFLSKNPYIKFEFAGKKGDTLDLTMATLLGEKQTFSAKVK
ncbi:MAG: thiosulfate oxidation carrier complex protein SoxZ [Arcobacteraceae bacterium]|nr:thiosulfate oxidation carrier complex protein SoxZ [Arcobacteraceae bacterium]